MAAETLRVRNLSSCVLKKIITQIDISNTMVTIWCKFFGVTLLLNNIDCCVLQTTRTAVRSIQPAFSNSQKLPPWTLLGSWKFGTWDNKETNQQKYFNRKFGICSFKARLMTDIFQYWTGLHQYLLWTVSMVIIYWNVLLTSEPHRSKLCLLHIRNDGGL